MPPFPSIDERHAKSRRAYLARDLSGDLAQFSPDVRYRQADGKVIGLDVLTKQVADQLNRMAAVDWRFTVDDATITEETAEETGTQDGYFAVTAFGFLHRLWRLTRRARYTWQYGSAGWRLAEVQVLTETVSGAGVQIGLRPRLPPLPS